MFHSLAVEGQAIVQAKGVGLGAVVSGGQYKGVSVVQSRGKSDWVNVLDAPKRVSIFGMAILAFAREGENCSVWAIEFVKFSSAIGDNGSDYFFWS